MKCDALLGENQNHSIFGAARVMNPPCSSNCPAHVDIPAYLDRIDDGNLLEAAETILSRNPMPAITGRICHISVMKSAIEATLTNQYSLGLLSDSWATTSWRMRLNSLRILRKIREECGYCWFWTSGTLRGLLPAQGRPQCDRIREDEGTGRYAKSLHTRVSAPKGHSPQTGQGSRRHGNSVQDHDRSRNRCHIRESEEEIDAVFLATGAWQQRKLGIQKEELLTEGVEFLQKVAAGDRSRPGNKVLVIGGGNVAVDVAMTALRLGAREVTMACLERREEMPSIPEDVEKSPQRGNQTYACMGATRSFKRKVYPQAWSLFMYFCFRRRPPFCSEIRCKHQNDCRGGPDNTRYRAISRPAYAGLHLRQSMALSPSTKILKQQTRRVYAEAMQQRALLPS